VADRRGYGEGGIWREGAYFVGRITLDGQRRKVKGKSEGEVAAKLFALRQRASTGTLGDTSRRVTVGAWLGEWLAGLFVEPKTLEDPRGVRAARPMPPTPGLRRAALRSLGTRQIRAFCRTKMATRVEGGGGLHQTTVHNIGMTLRIALGAAVELGLITRNPAAVRKTIPPPAPREMLSWEPEECQAFLAAARGDRWEVLFHVALATGMRQGELRGLRWSAVDLGAGTVAVKASVSASRRRKGPKTISGERLLHLAPHVVDLLAASRAARKVVDLADDELVFPNDEGRPFLSNSIRLYHFNPLMRRAGVRRLRFHDLRHTFATLLLRSGVPMKDVAYMLGHSDAATTIRVYAHAIPSTHGSHARALGALLTGGSVVHGAGGA
jgi:integrase